MYSIQLELTNNKAVIYTCLWAKLLKELIMYPRLCQWSWNHCPNSWEENDELSMRSFALHSVLDLEILTQ